MTVKKVLFRSTILSIVLTVLLVVFRYSESELYTFLSLSLGGTVFFTLLFYLFETEKIRNSSSLTKYKYIFYLVSIPLLIFAVYATSETDGLLNNAVRIFLTIEIFYLIFSWTFTKWKIIQTLKNEKSMAELTLLKEQINPHFFFNTLNNLYSLIKKDPNAAQDYVLKLSDLMRFTIYDSDKNSVSFGEEINYLTNFIDLQTSRYHKTVDINFVKSIQCTDTTVAPLLFIILLENAFKHGVESVIENAFINIELIENSNKISFTIKNNFDHISPSKKNGIGLKNLKQRLDLLYPNNYVLTSDCKNDVYSATLEILKR